MKNFIGILLNISLWLSCYASNIILPTIRWDPSNPLFTKPRCTKDGYAHIYFDMQSFMYFSCPSLSQRDWFSTKTVDVDQLYENLWIVSEDEFKRCQLNKKNKETRRLLYCNDVYNFDRIIHKKIVIKDEHSTIDDIIFQENQTYYFIGTSDGTKNGIDNTEGGHCKSRNMKLAITMCPYGSYCGTEETICTGLEKPTTTQLPTTTTTSTLLKVSPRLRNLMKTKNVSPVVAAPYKKGDENGVGKSNGTRFYIILAFIGGILFGVVIMLAIRYVKRRGRSRNNSDGSSETGSSVFTDPEKIATLEKVEKDGEIVDHTETLRREANRKYFSSENPSYRNSTEFKRLLSTQSHNSGETRYSATPVGEYGS